jgi:hypothetical protein
MDEKVLDKIRRRLTFDKAYMDDCVAYDDMEAMRWTPPNAFKAREEVRIRVSTDAHDILKTATNLFDVHHPKWEVLPRGPADAERAEEIERWLEWFMRLANQNGDQEVFRVMLKHSTKFNRICAQVEYEPYWLEKNTDAYKEALVNPFEIILHYPGNVHYEMGKRLRWVAAVSNVPASDCLDKWENYKSETEDGRKIKRALDKIQAFLDDDDEARIMYVDYTDKDKRWVFAYPTDYDTVDMDLEVPEDYINIFEGANELGFINWEISAGTSDPLLYSLHHGGLWENQCFIDTILDTTGIRRGFAPLLKHTSVSGKPLDIDFSGGEAVVELVSADGETADYMMPPPLDPAIRELADRNSQKGASATGLKGLQNMNIAGNIQFASIQAMIQVSKSALDPYIRNFEKAAVGIARLALLWAKKNGDTLSAYRTKTKNKEKGLVAGQKISVGKDDYDPKLLVIQCELMSNNPGDEMTRMNVFSQAKQLDLPVPDGFIVEKMGWGQEEVMKADWLKEKIEKLALALYQKSKELEVEMQAQQMAQAAMQPQQPPQGVSPPQEGAGQQPALAAAGGQGFDPNQGGNPPATAAPMMTQTATRSPA